MATQAPADLKRRRLELLLAFPAFVADVGGTRAAARVLAVDERIVRRHLEAAREAAARARASGAEGNVLLSAWGVRGIESPGVPGALARWLDARRVGGAA